MDEFFGFPWETLTLDQVRSAFADLESEGLTWEAKGTERPRPEVVRRSVCGLANAGGGFLVVGVSGGPGAWAVDGVEFAGGEPSLWLGQVIRDGLRPAPRHSVKEWTVEGARKVAIVDVDPVAEPPCMTRGGEVFERVSGATVAVQDPATLRRMLERGEAATAGAEAIAIRALEREIPDPGVPIENRLSIGMAFGPVGKADDIASRLFTASFDRTLQDAFNALPERPLLPGSPHAHNFYSLDVTSASHWIRGHTNREVWTIRASWDGSVGVFLDLFPERNRSLIAGEVFVSAVRPAADTATALVAELGGYGRAHVVLRFDGVEFSLLHNPHQRDVPESGAVARTWTDESGALSDDALARMQREILRACGIPAYEPEVE